MIYQPSRFIEGIMDSFGCKNTFYDSRFKINRLIRLTLSVWIFSISNVRFFLSFFIYYYFYVSFIIRKIDLFNHANSFQWKSIKTLRCWCVWRNHQKTCNKTVHSGNRRKMNIWFVLFHEFKRENILPEETRPIEIVASAKCMQFSSKLFDTLQILCKLSMMLFGLFIQTGNWFFESLFKLCSRISQLICNGSARMNGSFFAFRCVYVSTAMHRVLIARCVFFTLI